MRLIRFELYKISGRKEALFGLLLIFAMNLFFFYAALSVTDSAAYKKLGSDIDKLSFDEKVSFVEEKYDQAMRIAEIDSYLRGNIPDELKERLNRLLSEYDDLYGDKKLVLYTESYAAELAFLSGIRAEIRTVRDYPSFLQGTQDTEQIYSSISIFGNADSFSVKRAKNMRDLYADLIDEDIVLDYYPQTGLTSALRYKYSDLFLLLSVIMLSSVLITSERESGMVAYMKTFSHGRAETGAAKSVVLLIYISYIVVCTYGINLAVGNGIYGLGDIRRSIQTLPMFMRNPLPLKVWNYILLFLFVKIMASWLLGLIVMIIVAASGNLTVGASLSIAFYYLNQTVYDKIHPNTAFQSMKYANYYGILRVEEWLGNYTFYRFKDEAVSLPSIAVAFWLVSVAVLFPAFLTVYSSMAAGGKEMSFTFSSRMKYTTIVREEWYKFFIGNRMAVLLLVFFVLTSTTILGRDHFITTEEIFYQDVLRPISGVYDKGAYDAVLEQLNSPEIQEIEQTEYLREKGLLTEDEYKGFYYSHYDLYKRREALLKTLDKIRYCTDKGVDLVYDTGYLKLFLGKESQVLDEALITIVILAIGVCNIYAQEKRSGMDRLLFTAKKGRRELTKAKEKTALLFAFTVTIIVCGLNLISIWRDYGLPSVMSPISSVKEFGYMPKQISILGYFVLYTASRFLAACLCSVIFLLLSKSTGNYIISLFYGIAGTGLPILLARIGFKGAKNFSVYPLFQIGEYLCNEETRIPMLIFTCLAVLVTHLLSRFLYMEKTG